MQEFYEAIPNPIFRERIDADMIVLLGGVHGHREVGIGRGRELADLVKPKTFSSVFCSSALSKCSVRTPRLHRRLRAREDFGERGF
jgi:hypothetical protein